MPQDDTARQQQQRALDKARKKAEEERDFAVLEIARALVGSADWPSASIYNIRLISGLELCQAILVVTKERSTTSHSDVTACRLHILPGFQAFSLITGSTSTGSRQAGLNRLSTGSNTGNGGEGGRSVESQGRVSPKPGFPRVQEPSMDIPFVGVECGVCAGWDQPSHLTE